MLGHQEIIRRPDGTALPVLVNAVALGMQRLTLSPTDELLDAARLQAGRLELAREATDLVALCRRVVARFQRTAPWRTISFERFERADNSRAYGIGGTGLGLYLSRALVEQHERHVWLESVEGQGSTFIFTLPLASEAPPAPD